MHDWDVTKGTCVAVLFYYETDIIGETTSVEVTFY